MEGKKFFGRFSAAEEVEWRRMFGFALDKMDAGAAVPVFELVCLGDLLLVQIRSYVVAQEGLEFTEEGVAWTLSQFRSMLKETEFLKKSGRVETSGTSFELVDLGAGGCEFVKVKKSGRVNRIKLTRAQWARIPESKFLLLFSSWKNEFGSFDGLKDQLARGLFEVAEQCSAGSALVQRNDVIWNRRFLGPIFRFPLRAMSLERSEEKCAQSVSDFLMLFTRFQFGGNKESRFQYKDISSFVPEM